MTSTRLALHTQTLEDVILLLERCSDPRATLAFRLALTGSLHALDETALQHLRKKDSGIFPKDIPDSPLLSGLTNLPFPSLLISTSTARILKQDIGGPNPFRFAPSLGSPAFDAQATLALLNNISNPNYSARRAIIHMHSPTLNRLRSRKPPHWPASDGILGHSALQITIAPSNEVFDLAVYENYLFSTLLVGRRVLVAYPPLRSNLSVLEQRYRELQGNNCGPVFLRVAEELQHGIAIIQQAGETLMLPPFWSHVAFCIETCVSAECFLATGWKYVDRLVNVELSLSVIGMWPSSETAQVELVKYATSLADHFGLVFGNKIKHFKGDKAIAEVCVKWDRGISGHVGRLCEGIAEDGERERIRDVFMGAWMTFLEAKRKKKAECRICHAKVQIMPYEGTPTERLERHFIDVHGIV
jgi:hypothetical protein